MTSIEHEITELWGHIQAATHRFLELLAEFDRTEAWAGVGVASCVQWLNLRCGIDAGTAREKLRVAHSLGDLPKVNTAFRDGRVSYSKVRAMTRVATPENEHILLNIAEHGTAAHVERTVRQFRRVDRVEEAQRAAQVQQERFINLWYENDAVEIRGRLPVEVGALIKQAIEVAVEVTDETEDVTEDVSAETSSSEEPDFQNRIVDRLPIGARRADALKLLAEHFLGSEGEKGGSADRYQVVVHIDQQRLSDTGPAEVGPKLRPALCELEDGSPLAVETARRLGCDGSLVGIVEGAGREPLDVGRKTRAIPPAIRRALRSRDRGCRFPGCTHTRFTEGHHLEHWADGGETKLSNLITLCDYHHHLIHEGGFSVRVTDDGVFRFTGPDGQPLAENFRIDRRFRGNVLPSLNHERGIAIDHRTIDTRWAGESMDYGIAIDALRAARRLASQVPASSSARPSAASESSPSSDSS